MRPSIVLLIALAPLAACDEDMPTEAKAPPTPVVAIRGATSLASGVNPISLAIDTVDIERVEILKGLAATPLYGKQCDLVIVVKTSRKSGL